ncbi:MAG: hypothetical protein ISS17_05310 [Bacteroidales bacterium]|nr:hypothetical protein [Bacteroidales bacterium]
MAFVNDTLLLLSNGKFYNLQSWFQGGNPEFAGEIGFGCETIRAIQTNAGTRVIAGLSDLFLPIRQIALYNPYDSLQGYPLLDIDSTNSNVNGLLISGDTVFCGKKTGNTFYLAMFRVVNDSLILIDTVPAPAEINGISRDGSLVAVTCGMFWFSWYYIDGNTLVQMGTYFDWHFSPTGVYLKNNLVYTADKFYGLKVFQLSEPPEATLVAECRGTGGWTNMFGSTAVNVGSNQGRKVSSFIIPELMPGSPIHIDRNGLPAGMYVCTIRSGGELIAIGKFIVY